LHCCLLHHVMELLLASGNLLQCFPSWTFEWIVFLCTCCAVHRVAAELLQGHHQLVTGCHFPTPVGPFLQTMLDGTHRVEFHMLTWLRWSLHLSTSMHLTLQHHFCLAFTQTRFQKHTRHASRSKKLCCLEKVRRK
jgi:hypothetical protein